MSSITPPRTPDIEIKGGTGVPIVVVFSLAGVAYAPSVAPTIFRTRVSDGQVTALVLTYSGTPAGGYTCTDTPPSSPNQELFVYEWKGTDAAKPPVTGSLVVKVNPSWGV